MLTCLSLQNSLYFYNLYFKEKSGKIQIDFSEFNGVRDCTGLLKTNCVFSAKHYEYRNSEESKARFCIFYLKNELYHF